MHSDHAVSQRRYMRQLGRWQRVALYVIAVTGKSPTCYRLATAGNCCNGFWPLIGWDIRSFWELLLRVENLRQYDDSKLKRWPLWVQFYSGFSRDKMMRNRLPHQPYLAPRRHFWIRKEQISYRYSSCSCSSSYCWGRPLHKSLMLRRFKSDRGEIWQDCSSGTGTHRLTESDFRSDVTVSRWRPWRHLTQICPAHMQQRPP